MNEVIVTTDLGHFKAYKIVRIARGKKKAQLLTTVDNTAALQKFGDKVTDSAGNFVAGGKKNKAGSGFGEPHNKTIEFKKRLIKEIAQHIKDIIHSENCSKWYLAANKEINKQIVDNLDSTIKEKLYKNVCSDLTKTHESEMLSYFIF